MGIAPVHGVEEVLQPLVEGGAGFVVGCFDVRMGLVFNRPGCGGELALELLQALLVVAAHLTDGEQVAALGIEQEEQAVEERERAAEEWFEQAVALPGGQRIQTCWQLAGMLCIENEAAREMWENLKTDPVFKALAYSHLIEVVPAGEI